MVDMAHSSCVCLWFFMLFDVYLCQKCIKLTLLDLQMTLIYEHSPGTELVSKLRTYCSIEKGVMENQIPNHLSRKHQITQIL